MFQKIWGAVERFEQESHDLIDGYFNGYSRCSVVNGSVWTGGGGGEGDAGRAFRRLL